MFIYEKNKINSETGKTEQTLNITFEGNKPVETPDVIVTKDGITGIKSDSNAYSLSFYTEQINLINSLSLDGEIVSIPELNTEYYSLTFTRYVGWNTTTQNPPIVITYKTDNYNYSGSWWKSQD